MKRHIRIPHLLPSFALGALLLAGCSDSARMERQLTSADPVERAAAAESLGVWGVREAHDALVAALRDSVPGVRERVAGALGGVGGPGTVPVLADVAVNDPDRGVRRSAAAALAGVAPDSMAELVVPLLHGPTQTAQLRAVQALAAFSRAAGPNLPRQTRHDVGASLSDIIRTVQNDREELPGNWMAWNAYCAGNIEQDDTLEVVGDQAAIALAWLGGNEAGRGLTDALNGLLAPVVRDSVLALLADRGDTDVIDAIAGQLGTSLVSSRLRAVQLLGGIPHESAVEALVKATRDAAEDVRREAWIALARVHGGRVLMDGTEPPSRPVRVVSGSVRSAADQALVSGPAYAAVSAAVLLTACDAVTDPVAVGKHLARFARERAGDARWTVSLYSALEGLDSGQRDVPVISAALATGFASSNPAINAAAIRASGRWVGPDRRGQSLRALEASNAEMRRAALVAIGYMRSTDYTAEILALFGADSLTRAEAARTMVEIASVSQQSVNYLVLILTNKETDRRHTAVEAIGQFARRLYRADSLNAYSATILPAIPWLAQMAHEEEVAALRVHALWALGYLPSFETNEALGVGLDDPAEEVRLTAIEGLLRLRGDVALPSVRRFAFSESESGRLRIVAGLGTLGSEKAGALLRDISVRDSSDRVRAAAREYLAP